MKKLQKNEGFTLIELLIVVAIIGIIAAIAVPGLLRARMAGNEASAIGTMRAVNSAQATFASSCGGGGYAGTFTSLATAPKAGGPAFVNSDVSAADAGGAKTPKSGYLFTLQGLGANVLTDVNAVCNGIQPTRTGFDSTAAPAAAGSTGTRWFMTDQSGQIRQDTALLNDMTKGTPLQ